MSVDAIMWAWSQPINPTEKLVLLAMADRADEYCRCKPSQERLQSYTGLDEESIQKCIESMCQQQIILPEYGPEHGSEHGRSHYTLSGVPCREHH